MTKIAVIIPYFQKKEGILRRALTSVLQQRLPRDLGVNVIVVDDGSPVSARTEVEGLDFISPYSLDIVNQPNGGVSEARNTGLRNVSADTTYVAFLDSDDVWNPDHLSIAISALNHGFDYYFCDHKRIGHHDSHLATIPFYRVVDATDALRIGKEYYEIDKELFFNFFLTNFVSQISTVVYRRSSATDIIFNTSLRTAGEDHLFLLQLVSKAQRICYSPDNLVTCGQGINIYAAKYSWEDPGHLIRYMGEILRLYEFCKHLPLSRENAIKVADEIEFSRKCFTYLTVRWFFKKRELWPPELVKMTRSDPKFWFWYPFYVPYVLVCFSLRLFRPIREEKE